jgi:GT2 family glycosyltransferase
MVTIIIPNYNGREYLGECLKAITENQITCVIIVVDDGSSDDSLELLATHYPEVKTISLASNMGFCHAVNVGIKATESEFVILLNNDTVVRPGFVEALQSAIAKDERIFSVAAKMLRMSDPSFIDSAGDIYTVFGWALGRGKGKKANRYQKEGTVFSACAGAAIYRRQYLEELGFFDEKHFAYLEDLDLGYAARLRGLRNRFCPQAEVLHAGSASSGSRYNPTKTALASRNSIYLIAKNMPLLQIVWNLPFLLLGFFIKFLFFCFKGMGRGYLAGLWQGIKLSYTKEARARKVRFRWKNLKYYLLVQLELYVNVFRK